MTSTDIQKQIDTRKKVAVPSATEWAALAQWQTALQLSRLVELAEAQVAADAR